MNQEERYFQKIKTMTESQKEELVTRFDGDAQSARNWLWSQCA